MVSKKFITGVATVLALSLSNIESSQAIVGTMCSCHVSRGGYAVYLEVPVPASGFCGDLIGKSDGRGLLIECHSKLPTSISDSVVVLPDQDVVAAQEQIIEDLTQTISELSQKLDATE